jgi:eukaryotic-like serine/threonine-protein kinase
MASHIHEKDLNVESVGRYRMLSKIGAGGMGDVYLAEDPQLRRKVALKVISALAGGDKNAKRRLEREAQAAAQLDHPNICSIYEISEVDGISFIAMQYIQGESLALRIEQGPIPLDLSMDIALQMTDALAEAHKFGIVHRDIKPQNVMLTSRNQVKLLDFGLARASSRSIFAESEDETLDLLTQPGTLVGTPSYMSPEQLRGESVDARTDIWSFGVMLYEMLSGKRPFEGKSTSELISSILRDEPALDQTVLSTEIKIVIERCLAKDREARYQDGGELHEVLALCEARHIQAPTEIKKTKRSALVGSSDRAKEHSIRSIAVLPLQNLSRDPEQEYLVDAMTDLLITDLAQIKALRVISRTSVMQYKEASKPLPEIAKELNVDGIVEGSILRAGPKIRISAQLIQANTDHHLWAKSYDRDMDDLFGLQSEVAHQIATEIKVKLSPRERSRLAKVTPVSREAHDAFLRGIYHFDRLELDKGMDYFQRSINIDPAYAPPYGRLARGYYYLGFFGLISPVQAFTKLKEAAGRALELDDGQAEAYGYRALARLYYDWDWAGADREFRRALELKPSHAEISHAYAHYLMLVGRTDEGLAACERAVDLDPMGAILTACLGWHCLFSRHIDEAFDPSLKALKLAPDLFWAHTVLGWAYEQKGMFKEAIAEYQTAVTLSGGAVMNVAALGHAFGVSGDDQQAEELLTQLTERSKTNYVSSYDIAVLCAGLDDRDRTFQWLERAFEERSSFLSHINWDPRFDPLRVDPRFNQLITRIGLPDVGQLDH